MKLIHRGKGSNAKKSSPAPLQSREKKIAVVADGAGAGSNSRQVAPDDVPVGANGYGSSKDEAFFEASPWLESDCEEDFFSANGDYTPARTFSAAGTPNRQQAMRPSGGAPRLPTLEDMLKAEPLKPQPLQKKLGDLLQERQEDGNAVAAAVAAAGDLSRNGSSRAGDGDGEEARQCCVPHLAWALSCRERRKHKRSEEVKCQYTVY